MGSHLFKECTGLTDINLPKNLKEINVCSFQGCTNLKKIILPESIENIELFAFEGCSSLTSIVIPQNVKSIHESAFDDCDNLKSIFCKPTTPPTVKGDYMFLKRVSGRKIYVPAGSREKYRTATYWERYASEIIEK